MEKQFENLTVKVEGHTITLVIHDYTRTIGTSASGKSKTIATTSGNRELTDTDGVVIGLNCYRKA